LGALQYNDRTPPSTHFTRYFGLTLAAILQITGVLSRRELPIVRAGTPWPLPIKVTVTAETNLKAGPSALQLEKKMKRIFKNLLPLVALCISAGKPAAQSVPPTPADALVNKSSTAVSYEVDKGDTKVDLKATTLIPEAKGEAKVEVKQGITYIEAKVERLGQPGKLGTQFLTYVLWAVSPDGRTSNLGEISR
jgi:hypothetical protein